MGLFDYLFKRPNKAYVPQNEGFWSTLTAYQPVFTSFGGNIYESELVRSAIDARATHCSKLEIKVNGTAKPKLQNKLKAAPNEFQTWGQFLYRVQTILCATNTCFLIPILNDLGDITGVYPVLPQCCQIKQRRDIPYLVYTFATGEEGAIELKRCGILTRFQFNDDFFGSSNRALSPTMELIGIQNQAIKESVKLGASYRFVAQLDNFAKSEDLAAERKRFSKANFSMDSEAGGLLLVPNTYKNLQQINSKPYVVDTEQMKLIKENVYDYFAVNSDVVQNKAFGDAWSAFYEGCIEPFAIQISEVLTRMFFTQREISEGSFVMATSNRLQYMTNSDKANVSAQMADRGLMSRNEIRAIWNLPPLPEEIGNTFPVRGEYYDLSKEEESNAGNEE